MTTTGTRSEAEEILALLEAVPARHAGPGFLNRQANELDVRLAKRKAVRLRNISLRAALLVLLVAANLVISYTYFSRSGTGRTSDREIALKTMTGLYCTGTPGGNLFNLKKEEAK